MPLRVSRISVADDRLVEELADGVEAPADFGRVEKRREQPVAQEAAAHRRHR